MPPFFIGMYDRVSYNKGASIVRVPVNKENIMDEYLQCLYNYISEHIAPSTHPNALEYRRCVDLEKKA